MSAVQKYREQMLRREKKRQVTDLRAGMRNLMLYYQQNDGCSLCRNQQWIYEESLQHSIPLVVGIFQQNAVCSNHLDLILNKAYQCLALYPRNYHKMVQIKEDQKSWKWQIARKMVLLKQLFEDQLLKCNEMLKEEIAQCFRESDRFHICVLDCAFGYGSWPIDEKSEQDEFWDIEIRCYSLSVVHSIIRKFPYMIACHFEGYPLSELLSQFQGLRRLSFYEMMINLLEENQNEVILAQIERTLNHHLNDIKGMNLNIEEKMRIYDWIGMCIRETNLQESTIKTVILFLKARGNDQSQSVNQIVNAFQQRGVDLSTLIHQSGFQDNSLMQIQL